MQIKEYIVHTEWSLLVVLKHRYTWLYMIISKCSQNTVHVLYKTYRTCLSYICIIVDHKVDSPYPHLQCRLHTILYLLKSGRTYVPECTLAYTETNKRFHLRSQTVTS